MGYPSLIIISDGFPWKNGAGLSQTLYNLFHGYVGKLFVLVANGEYIPPKDECLEAETVYFNDAKPVLIKNRLGKYLNPILLKQRFRNRERMVLQFGLPSPADAIILVSTTIPEKLHLAWLLSTKENYHVLPYFMDDWLADNTFKWNENSIQKIASNLLQQASARLMISENLKQRFETHFNLLPKPTLIIHNPSPPPIQSNIKISPGLLVYAGSIWPMHADALLAVAASIRLLQMKGKKQYRLKIFCPENQWDKYKDGLNGPGVSYAGWLPAEKVHSQFPEAWVLVCTASFLKAHFAFSQCSVQTKLTDYIAAARPVLVVAPIGAASGKWVEDLGCGYWVKDESPANIANHLEKIAIDESDWLRKANMALNISVNIFSEQKVQTNLYSFLKELNPNNES